MNNRQSYLDSMNAGRRRRATTSLQELSQTLEELEGRIRRPYADETSSARPLGREPEYRDAPSARDWRRSPRDRAPVFGARDSHSPLSGELNALRDELRDQMGTGLRREFAGLKSDIERALHSAAPVSQAAQLGAEFERLSGTIHRLTEQSDDRQIDMLRREMADVKQSLGKLAREETVQSFDRRWDELDQRWQDIAAKLSDDRRAEQDNMALRALTARLEQISEAMSGLPTSMTLRSLEEKVKSLAAAMDHHSAGHGGVAPQVLDAIEERLNEISRAVAAATAMARPAPIDPEPFERIEARISLLARQLGEVAEDNPSRHLAGQLDSLARRVEELAHRVDVPERAVERLADQIDSISSKLDKAPAAPNFDAVLGGLEQRFASLSSMIEQRQEDAFAHGQSLFRDLEQQLQQVAVRIDTEVAGAPADAGLIAAMDARFDDLASRLERQAPEPIDDRMMRELESRLDAISQRMDSSAREPALDHELIRSLESQIAGLAQQISSPVTMERDGDSLGPRLDRIEQSISGSRGDVLEAARKAAEDAVRSFAGTSAEGALAAGLADDLKALEALTRKSDDRNAKTFEAIHDTLLKIVDRLGAVETGARQAKGMLERDTQLGVDQTPSLEPMVEALPLFAGDPEPAARPQQTAPHRSAAAAAAEAAAEAVRSEEAAGGSQTGGRLSMLGGLTRALTGRKSKQAAEKTEPAVDTPETAATIEPTAPEIEPAIDPVVANQPLEPGSGAPDLNAIMRRVRDERGQPGGGPAADTAKADFIAAARRAAQAAAAEAEIMKRNPVAKAGKGGFSLGGYLKTKRKPVLMGVAAVLMALAALQVGKSITGGPEQVAEIATPGPLVSEVAELGAMSLETTPLEDDVAEIAPAPVVRMATEAPRQSASSLLTDVPASASDVTAGWLENDEVAADAAPAPVEIDEASVEPLPDPDVDALAAIPADAGPVALREAAAAGDPKALFEIGNRYAQGRGVPEDMTQAAIWYERAAEQGLAPAEYRIGNLYEKGVGVTRDVSKAKTWYQLAAAQGNASAMHNLAVLHAMGADGVTDNDSAARWFAEAADFGVVDSQFNLGILAAKGVGMRQDLEAAYKWFALVAKGGDRDSAEKRDEVANALRPEQLERARASAELWRAKPVDPEANVVEVPESWSESEDITASVDMRQVVRNIQRILNKNGYDAGSEDGLMGQRTKSAIHAFQTASGMRATGEVDEQLVRALLEKR